jgi:hypothetical protein
VFLAVGFIFDDSMEYYAETLAQLSFLLSWLSLRSMCSLPASIKLDIYPLLTVSLIAALIVRVVQQIHSGVSIKSTVDSVGTRSIFHIVVQQGRLITFLETS